MQEDIVRFRRNVWTHFRKHARDFAWRHTKHPYHILLSEVMLQQTQTQRVTQKYPVFLRRFPSFSALAHARQRSVLRVWQGMGYNRRALALCELAKIVVRDFHGKLPKDPAELQKLPGIGPATAAAISAFSFNKGVPFVETNIRRAIIHHFFSKRKNIPEHEILNMVARTMNKKKPREWFWALMDYGAMLTKVVATNPNIKSAVYKKQTPFHGSQRELRGKIMRLLLEEAPQTLDKAARSLRISKKRIRMALAALQSERLIVRGKEDFFIP